MYGNRKDFSKKYVLTPARLPYKIVKSFGLHMRPQEVNVINNIPGTNIFLYDTRINVPMKNIPKNNMRVNYFMSAVGHRLVVKEALRIIKEAILKRLHLYIF